MSWHWWKTIYVEGDWGVRKCRVCKKWERETYDAETALIVWVAIDGNT
jgi:hypothetical protein